MAAGGAIRRTVLAVLAAALGLGAAGCGGSEAERPPATTAASTTTAVRPPAAGLRVALVTGPSTGEGLPLRALAGLGVQRAVRELGVTGRVVMSHGAGDDERRLEQVAGRSYDLVITLGLPARVVDAVARRHPTVPFALVDVSRESLPSRPPNVRGLLFAEQESGYLAGYLAGLLSRAQAGSRQVVGSVGGRKTPAVDRYIAGFQAGARAAAPKIETLNAYTGGFGDAARCKELALDEIAQGAVVVFPVAGRCGLGALEAARERSVWGIGVDADRSSLGGHILTSAVKNVGVAVFLTIQALRDGRFAGGEDVVFGVASGGVGLGVISPQVPAEVVARVKQVQDAIAAGRIAGIPETPRTPG